MFPCPSTCGFSGRPIAKAIAAGHLWLRSPTSRRRRRGLYYAERSRSRHMTNRRFGTAVSCCNQQFRIDAAVSGCAPAGAIHLHSCSVATFKLSANPIHLGNTNEGETSLNADPFPTATWATRSGPNPATTSVRTGLSRKMKFRTWIAIGSEPT